MAIDTTFRDRVVRSKKTSKKVKIRRKQGSIVLFTKTGAKVVERRYSDATGRKYIIGRWKGEYGDRFRNFFYHIVPDEITSEF